MREKTDHQKKVSAAAEKFQKKIDDVAAKSGPPKKGEPLIREKSPSFVGPPSHHKIF